MIELKNTCRITLDGCGGATLDDVCRDAARIKELVSDTVQVFVIHMERRFKVEAQIPYIATPMDIPSGNYAAAQMATNQWKDLHK